MIVVPVSIVSEFLGSDLESGAVLHGACLCRYRQRQKCHKTSTFQ